MNWLNKLERKLGRYAIPNLILYLIGAYSVGFVLNMVAPSILNYLNFQPYYILHGQIWRLVTWIFMPTDSNILFLIIMMMLYYQLGMALERTWGTFRFNVYIIGGILVTELGSFLVYGLIYGIFGRAMALSASAIIGADDQYKLHQHVHFPCVCNTLSGYAGYAVFHHPNQDEVDGSGLCCHDGIQCVGYFPECSHCDPVNGYCALVRRHYALMCDLIPAQLPHFLPLHEEFKSLHTA